LPLSCRTTAAKGAAGATARPLSRAHIACCYHQALITASLDAEQRVVPESDVKHLQAQVRELQRLLGKKTMEVEILKEAIELAKPKKRLLLRSHLPNKDGGE
jgi:hypothetical protein